MKILEASLGTVILRYFLMTYAVIALAMTGNLVWTVIALPIFMTAILGVKFRSKSPAKKRTKSKVLATPPSRTHELALTTQN